MAWEWLPVLGGAAGGAALNQAVQIVRDAHERGRASQQRSADTRQRLRESAFTAALLYLAEVESRAVAARSAARVWKTLASINLGAEFDGQVNEFDLSTQFTEAGGHFAETVRAGWDAHRHTLWSLGSAQLRREIDSFSRTVVDLLDMQFQAPGNERFTVNWTAYRAAARRQREKDSSAILDLDDYLERVKVDESERIAAATDEAGHWVSRTVTLRDALRREIDLQD